MNQMNLHLNISNSLEKTLGKTKQIMDSFNRSVTESVGRMKVLSGQGNIFNKFNTKSLSSVERSNEFFGKTGKTIKDINKTGEEVTEKYSELEENSKKITFHTKIWNKFLGVSLGLVGRLVAPLISIFSIAAIIDSTKALLRYNAEMKNLSYRMGFANKATKEFTNSLFFVAKATGESLENASMLLSTLIRYRVPIKDLKLLASSAGFFSEITGVTAEKASRLVGELNRIGRVGRKGIEDILKTMVSVQRSVGLTENEMENISDTIIYATRAANQFGKSEAFQEDLAKGIVELAGAFSKVGVEATNATQLIERIIDPARIQENMFLISQLGINLEDALNMNFNPQMLPSQFKDLAQRVKEMGVLAGSQFSQALGIPYRALLSMAEMGNKAASEQKISLENAAKQQRDAARRFQVVMNNVRTTIAGVLSHTIPIIEKLSFWFQNAFSKLDFNSLGNKIDKFIKNIDFNDIFNKAKNIYEKIKEIITNIFDPKIWAAGGLALLGLMFLMRKKFFAMAVGFGEKIENSVEKAGNNLQSSFKKAGQELKDSVNDVSATKLTEELRNSNELFGKGLERSIDRASDAVSEMRGEERERSGERRTEIRERTGNFGRRARRAEDVRQRVLEGEQYQKIQEVANSFEVLAQSNIHAPMAKLADNTAIWLRKISLGAKPVSFLETKTEQINKKIIETQKLREQENIILQESYNQQKINLESIGKNNVQILSERLSALDKINEREGKLTGKQEKEYRKITALKEKKEKEIAGLNLRIEKDNEKFEVRATKHLRRLSAEQQKNIAIEILQEKEKHQSQITGHNVRLEHLAKEREIHEAFARRAEVEKVKLNSLERESGELSFEQREQYKKIQDQLRDYERILSGIRNETDQINSEMEKVSKEYDKTNKLAERLQSITSKTALEIKEGVDTPLLKSLPEKISNVLGAVARNFKTGINDFFVKTRDSWRPFADSVKEIMSPRNWLRAIRGAFRTRREERARNSEFESRERLTKGIGGLIKKFAIFAGLATLVAGALSKLKILDEISNVLQSVIGSVVSALEPIITQLIKILFPMLLRVFAALLPLLASLVNVLLPPLIAILGGAVWIIGVLIKGLGKLIEEFALLPTRLFKPNQVEKKREELRQSKFYKSVISPLEETADVLTGTGKDMIQTGFDLIKNPALPLSEVKILQEGILANAKAIEDGTKINKEGNQTLSDINSSIKDQDENVEILEIDGDKVTHYMPGGKPFTEKVGEVVSPEKFETIQNKELSDVESTRGFGFVDSITAQEQQLADIENTRSKNLSLQQRDLIQRENIFDFGNSQDYINTQEKIFEDVKNFFKNIGNIFVNKEKEKEKDINDGINNFFGSIVSFFSGKTIREKIKEEGDKINQEYLRSIDENSSMLQNFITTQEQSRQQNIKELNETGNTWKYIWDTNVDNLNSLYGSIWSEFKRFFGIGELFKPDEKKIQEFNEAGNTWKYIINTNIDNLNNLYGKIGGFFGGLWRKLNPTEENLQEISQAQEEMKQRRQETLNRFKLFFSGIWRGLTGQEQTQEILEAQEEARQRRRFTLQNVGGFFGKIWRGLTGQQEQPEIKPPEEKPFNDFNPDDWNFDFESMTIDDNLNNKAEQINIELNNLNTKINETTQQVLDEDLKRIVELHNKINLPVPISIIKGTKEYSSQQERHLEMGINPGIPKIKTRIFKEQLQEKLDALNETIQQKTNNVLNNGVQEISQTTQAITEVTSSLTFDFETGEVINGINNIGETIKTKTDDYINSSVEELNNKNEEIKNSFLNDSVTWVSETGTKIGQKIRSFIETTAENFIPVAPENNEVINTTPSSISASDIVNNNEDLYVAIKGLNNNMENVVNELEFIKENTGKNVEETQNVVSKTEDLVTVNVAANADNKSFRRILEDTPLGGIVEGLGGFLGNLFGRGK